MMSTKLPDEFIDLQRLAEEFAIGDDVNRDAATNVASVQQKRELVDRLSPRLDAINNYLDQNDDDSAHLLGRLAEAACEVALEIGWPKGREAL